MRQSGLKTNERLVSTETIRHARSPGDIERARALFVEYAQGLKVDLCLQGFEQELATLPRIYAPPLGRLLLAGAPGAAFGCIALRPLQAASGLGRVTSWLSSPAVVAEVKRLYVQPAYRGQGWAKRLVLALCDEARVIGYQELKLDSLVSMNAARALYFDLGFRECAPYYDSPFPGAVYMELTL